MRIKILLILFAVTLLGGVLRFYKVTQNPPSLNGDELSFGYNAFSILKTGKDEYGNFLPLVFKSVGDYKNPLPAYLMLPSIKIFGLTDFAVRLPNAFFGTLFIPVFFLFLLYILKNKFLAILGSILIAGSSWYIFYSRFAYEPLIGSFFVFLGIFSYMKFLDGRKKYLLASAFFLVLSMYTAFSTKMFAPLFAGVLILYTLKHSPEKYRDILKFAAVCAALAAPLAYTILFMGAGTRFQMVLISNDIEFSRYVLLKYFAGLADLPLLFFFWLKRYLSYLDPNFLFFNGLRMTTFDNFGLGLFYIFEIPWLILGTIAFIKKQIPHKNILIIWLLTGLIPDSLTNNQQHAGRLLHIGPVIILLIVLGLNEFIKWIKNIRNRIYKYSFVVFYSVLVGLFVIHAFLIFTVMFPRDKGEFFDEGLREASLFVGQNQDKYKEIVFDTRHGVSAPDMISNPFLYLLFYLKYDPAKYQNTAKAYGTPDKPSFHFDKYTFRYIDWHTDCYKKDTLFIGSPWSFPSDLRGVNVIKKIYLTGGDVAYLAATATCQ